MIIHVIMLKISFLERASVFKKIFISLTRNQWSRTQIHKKQLPKDCFMTITCDVVNFGDSTIIIPYQSKWTTKRYISHTEIINSVKFNTISLRSIKVYRSFCQKPKKYLNPENIHVYRKRPEFLGDKQLYYIRLGFGETCPKR